MMESLELRMSVLPDEVKSDMQINELNLQDNILKQPSLYAYYAYLYSEKMKESSQAKLTLCTVEGQISDQYTAEVEAGKKMTDSVKEKRMKSEPKWKMAKSLLDKAEAEEEYYRNLLEALKQKRDMLYQLALRQRDEIKSNITIQNPNITDMGNSILERLK